MQIIIWELLLLSLLKAGLFNLNANLSSTKFFQKVFLGGARSPSPTTCFGVMIMKS